MIRKCVIGACIMQYRSLERKKGMEIIYFIHAKNVNVLCFGAKQMSDLIKQVGGIEKAKKIIAEMPRYAVIYSTVFDQYFDGLTGEYEDIILDDLRQSIADHDRTDTCVDIRNHLSPSTKVIER